MRVTDDGMVISVSFEQSKNAMRPMVVSPSGSVTDVRPEQP